MKDFEHAPIEEKRLVFNNMLMKCGKNSVIILDLRKYHFTVLITAVSISDIFCSKFLKLHFSLT